MSDNESNEIVQVRWTDSMFKELKSLYEKRSSDDDILEIKINGKAEKIYAGYAKYLIEYLEKIRGFKG